MKTLFKPSAFVSLLGLSLAPIAQAADLSSFLSNYIGADLVSPGIQKGQNIILNNDSKTVTDRAGTIECAKDKLRCVISANGEKLGMGRILDTDEPRPAKLLTDAVLAVSKAGRVGLSCTETLLKKTGQRSYACYIVDSVTSGKAGGLE